MPGRRREDPRPPIEVIGAEPPPEDTARITVGGEPGRRRRVVVAALVALVAIVAVSVAVGGDEPEEAAERTTTTRTRATRRSTTSTAPVVTAPLGPQLPQPTGGAALLVGLMGVSPSGTWVHLDLDTGTRTEVRMPSEDGRVPVGVRGGVVHIVGTRARFIPLPAGDPVELGEAEQAFASGSASEVWLVTAEGPDEPERPLVARRVEAATGAERSERLSIPPGAWVVGAANDAVVVVAGGNVYRFAQDGDIDLLGPGDVHGMAGDHVVLSRCDRRARCAPTLVHATTGRERAIPGAPAAVAYGWAVSASDEGELAIVTHGPAVAELWLGAGLGDRLRGPEPLFNYVGDTGAWLPDRQGLVVMWGSPLRATRFLVAGDEIVREPIPALAEDHGDFVVVIPP